MGKELFSEIGVVRAGELQEGPITPGQIRRKALEVGDLWVGECHVTALDQPSQWHHHKDFDSVMYMLSGRIRVDHGPGGTQSFELGGRRLCLFPAPGNPPRPDPRRRRQCPLCLSQDRQGRNTGKRRRPGRVKRSD